MKKTQLSLGTQCSLIKSNIDILWFCEEHYNAAFIQGTKGWAQTNCLLPGHDDSNPSFSVNQELGQFMCFGCGHKGSIIDLVMIIEGYTMRQAVEFLSNYIEFDFKDHISEKLYNIKSLLKSNGSSGATDKDSLLRAKLQSIKSKYSNDSKSYYNYICKLFRAYTDESEKRFIDLIFQKTNL